MLLMLFCPESLPQCEAVTIDSFGMLLFSAKSQEQNRGPLEFTTPLEQVGRSGLAVTS